MLCGALSGPERRNLSVRRFSPERKAGARRRSPRHLVGQPTSKRRRGENCSELSSKRLAPSKTRVPGVPVAHPLLAESPAQVYGFTVASGREIHEARLRVAHHNSECLDLSNQVVEGSLRSRIARRGGCRPV